MTEKNPTEFTYSEWHLLWKAVEARATQYWAYVEKYQIETKETPQSESTELWIHFLELAEEQTALLNKLEVIANENFPRTNPEPFPQSPPELRSVPNDNSKEPFELDPTDPQEIANADLHSGEQ